MKCDLCKRDYEKGYTISGLKGDYCSENCMVQFSNKMRLGFLPFKSYDENIAALESKFVQTSIANSGSAIGNFLINDLNSDQLMIFIQLCQNAVNNATLLVHTKKRSEEGYHYDKVRSDIRALVDRRDTDAVATVVADREKKEKVKAVKALGEKISKDGKCLICQSDSTALTCSKKCKENHLMIDGFLKMGKSIEYCREQLRKMGRI